MITLRFGCLTRRQVAVMADNRRPLPFQHSNSATRGRDCLVSCFCCTRVRVCSEICPRNGVKLNPVLWEEVVYIYNAVIFLPSHRLPAWARLPSMHVLLRMVYLAKMFFGLSTDF